MTVTEIKKLYTKTKKAYEKRTGEKYTWVMNAAQQRKGTATVCVGVVIDYVARLQSAEQHLANFEKDWAERVADRAKRAKEEAWKNEHTPGWYFGKNNDYWQILMQPEKLAEDRERELQWRKRHAAEAAERLEKYGDYTCCYKRATDKAAEMIGSPEVQIFLQQIGGTASVEAKPVCHSTEVHIRFHYQPSKG